MHAASDFVCGSQKPAADADKNSETTKDARLDTGFLLLLELILKDRRSLYGLLRNKSLQVALLPRFLSIALAGFALFGVSLSLVFSVSGVWPVPTSIATLIELRSVDPIMMESIPAENRLAPWIHGDALVLTAAYAFGLIAASGVCLPSLYFYCLLAGVRMSMLEIVVHAVKSKAIAAVVLVGILPIYMAIAMGVGIFGGSQSLQTVTLLFGLILPFVAGLSGTAALYQGFAQLCDTMPPDRAARRECFLRRLVLSWAACYTAVMPVMIYSLWETLS